jgi:deoxyribodipyrimidine photo-lyase
MRGIIWFREDLRTHDNKALYHAAQSCQEGIIGVYILDTISWQRHDIAACRVDFILRGLQQLSHSLQRLNIPLIWHAVGNPQDIAKDILQLLQQYNAKALFFNKQYEIDESRRDQTVESYLKN